MIFESKSSNVMALEVNSLTWKEHLLSNCSKRTLFLFSLWPSHGVWSSLITEVGVVKPKTWNTFEHLKPILTTYSSDALKPEVLPACTRAPSPTLIYQAAVERLKTPCIHLSLLSCINIHGSAGCVCAMAVSLAFDPLAWGLSEHCSANNRAAFEV